MFSRSLEGFSFGELLREWKPHSITGRQRKASNLPTFAKPKANMWPT